MLRINIIVPRYHRSRCCHKCLSRCPSCSISQWVNQYHQHRACKIASHRNRCLLENFLKVDHRRRSASRACHRSSASKARNHLRCPWLKTHHLPCKTDLTCSPISSTTDRQTCKTFQTVPRRTICNSHRTYCRVRICNSRKTWPCDPDKHQTRNKPRTGLRSNTCSKVKAKCRPTCSSSSRSRRTWVQGSRDRRGIHYLPGKTWALDPTHRRVLARKCLRVFKREGRCRGMGGRRQSLFWRGKSGGRWI